MKHHCLNFLSRMRSCPHVRFSNELSWAVYYETLSCHQSRFLSCWIPNNRIWDGGPHSTIISQLCSVAQQLAGRSSGACAPSSFLWWGGAINPWTVSWSSTLLRPIRKKDLTKWHIHERVRNDGSMGFFFTRRRLKANWKVTRMQLQKKFLSLTHITRW